MAKDILYGTTIHDDLGVIATVWANSDKGTAWIAEIGGADGIYIVEEEFLALTLGCAEQAGLSAARA